MAQKLVIDFSQTKDAGGFSPKHKEEGEYLGTIVSFEDTKSKKTQAPMWVFGIQLKSDRRAVYPVYCLLNPDQVWKLRNMMMAAGINVPKKKINVDANRLIGKDIGIFLEDDEYEGKPKSVIGSFFPASEYDGPAADESDDDDLPDEDEEIEDEEYDDGDEDNIPDDGYNPSETEPEDDEDEAEEEPPAKPAKKVATKKKPAPEPEDDDEDEADDEMDVEDL